MAKGGAPNPEGGGGERALTQSSRPRAHSPACRFEQTNLDLQPNPLAAMDLIAQVPVNMVEGRVATCDGGKG